MSIRKFLFALLLAASAADAQQLAAWRSPLAFKPLPAIWPRSLIPRLDYANGINDLGQIAGNGLNANGDLQAAWRPCASWVRRLTTRPTSTTRARSLASTSLRRASGAPRYFPAARFKTSARRAAFPASAAPSTRAGRWPGHSPSALATTMPSRSHTGRHGRGQGRWRVPRPPAIGPGHDHAFLYANGKMKDLGAFSGDRSDAFGINDAGQVVGTSLVTGVGGEPNTWRAFEYSGGALNELGVGGDYSIAWDINNAGQVVGQWVPSSEGLSHAFVYKDGILQDLGDLGGGNTSALSINDRGDIVGYGATGRGDILHGFIYADGKLVDLNTLLVAPDGWQITRTSAINEERQIASLACRIDNEFQCMPALLSPVPEPAASVLWSGGLLLLASRWVLRRPSPRHAVER